MEFAGANGLVMGFDTEEAVAGVVLLGADVEARGAVERQTAQGLVVQDMEQSYGVATATRAPGAGSSPQRGQRTPAPNYTCPTADPPARTPRATSPSWPTCCAANADVCWRRCWAAPCPTANSPMRSIDAGFNAAANELFRQKTLAPTSTLSSPRSSCRASPLTTSTMSPMF